MFQREWRTYFSMTSVSVECVSCVNQISAGSLRSRRSCAACHRQRREHTHRRDTQITDPYLERDVSLISLSCWWSSSDTRYVDVSTLQWFGLYCVTESGQMAAQVSTQHRGVGQVLVWPNDRSVRARDLGHWTQHWPTPPAVRESTERTRSDWSWEVALAFRHTCS